MISAIYLKSDHARPNARNAITRVFTTEDGYTISREGETYRVTHPDGKYALRLGGAEVHEVREVETPAMAKAKPPAGKEAAA
jgi:hypothetical protein